MMRIDSSLSDRAISAELGSRLKRLRLEHNLDQRGLAEEAGVSRTTVQRMEEGETVTLTSLLRVMRTLGIVEAFERAIPEPLPSPIQQLDLQGRQRQRASGRRTRRRLDDPE
jgi:transcriptional regulator with XRE-family HTH domain